MPKLFSKNIEDFICEVCGKKVVGDGYTNHCPYCLASKHVDINPGDRLSDCGGIMLAIGYEIKNGKEFILHHCQKCGFERKNKVTDKDNRKKLIELSATHFSKR